MPPRRKERAIDRAKLDATPPWELRTREPVPPTTGPYDITDAPDDGKPRVDLGALLVPVTEDLELRLEVNRAQQVVAVVVSGPHGHVQLGVFAAPRNEGIWDEVRAEIAESLRANRGNPTEREGQWGTEITGSLVGERGAVPVRFVGVNGPRWFLRAMFVGAVATDQAKAKALEDVLHDSIVHRGGAPLPVREPVPLQMPRDNKLPDELGGGTGASDIDAELY